MRTLPTVTLALLASVFTAQEALAEVETYVLEKPHTQIIFGTKHLGFTTSYGRFHEFDGGFTFDRANPENSSAEATIQTASIDMGTKPWDDHMKNQDFFHVTKFPTMTFKSTNIEMTGENTANITGNLTILEKTHPVTLATTLNHSGEQPFDKKYHAGFSATGTLNRTDWGMDYGVAVGVGDVVELIIEVDGIRQ